MNQFMCKKFGVLIFWVIMMACSIVSAREWTSDNIILQIPDDSSWNELTPLPSPLVKFGLQKTDKSADILFLCGPAPENVKDLDEFVKGFEQGYWQAGKSMKETGEFLNFKGKKAYKTTGELFLDNGTFKKGIIIWLEDGKVFEISTMKVKTDPFADPVIKNFFDSVKFASQPSK